MASYKYEECPEEEDSKHQYREPPSLLSQCTLSWMNPVLSLGNKRYLEQDDLLALEKQDDVKIIAENLNQKWHQEVENRKAIGKQPRLWLCLLKVVPKSKILLFMLLSNVCCLCLVSLAVILNIFLNLLQHRSDINVKYIWACAVSMPLISLVNGMFQDNFHFVGERLGMQLKAALIAATYHKILRTGKEDIQAVQTGHVINLLSNDAISLQSLPIFAMRLIYTPFYLVSLSVYLFFTIGLSAVTGIVLCVIMIPGMVIMFATAYKTRAKMAASSDARIGMVTECVSGIRSVKAHALEDKYEAKIDKARRNEMWNVLQKNLLEASMVFASFSFRQLYTFGIIVTMYLFRKHITAGSAFLILVVAANLGQYYLICLQWSSIVIAMAMKSIHRFQEFLLLPDVSKTSEGSIDAKHREEIQIGNLQLRNVTCLASQKLDHTIVEDITLDISQGSLVALTGPVGSGKSSLLLAVTKEIRLESGEIRSFGKVAYVPQTPWVFSGTIKENITFNMPFEHDWYQKVIAACQLAHDIEDFPDNDQTIVGERGVTLSGGQQSRISLARAVYAYADIYLLDNPLCAVDVKVGQRMFDECINGLLGKKTRILVTHNIEFMKQADNIVVMEEGSVRDQFPWSDNKVTVITKLVKEQAGMLTTSGNVSGDDQLKGTDDQKSSPTEGLKFDVESRQTGRVTWGTYWRYLIAGSSQIAAIGAILLAILGQVAYIAPDIWLVKLTSMDTQHQQNPSNIYIYIALNVVTFVFACVRVMAFYCLSYKSSIALHRDVTTSIVHAPVLFFDTTPAGRIINRFSKDFGNVDSLLPVYFITSIMMFFLLCSTVIVASFTNYWVLLGSVPMTVCFIWFCKYFLNGSRELKRLEAICTSPVYSHAMESMDGLETIRAHGMQEVFIERLYKFQNKNNQANVMCMGGQNWMGIRAQIMFSFLIGTVSIASVLMDQNPGLTGLALGYCLPISAEAIIMAKWIVETESLMTSTERVMEYTKLAQEPGYSVKTMPPDNWPTTGHIVLDDVTMRYYDGGPSILKGISGDLGEKSKVGVAGRTGAGKSSLVAALMRMPEAEGKITIDGIDIATINLQFTRKCISVFSQTPVLFSGSIRDNLDPFSQYSEDELWNSLAKVQLTSLVGGLEGKLEYQLAEDGSNLSMGERQLLCLARTLLRRNKILVLDEPTAHVDPLTESLIQQALQGELEDCTVITIAHRLNTLADCDKVMVLESGQIIGYGSTNEMLRNEHGTLAQIIEKEDSD